MDTKPIFGKFVRSVEGRAVPRYGSGFATTPNELIGAERLTTTAAERATGAPTIRWFPERVVALPVEYCRRYAKELAQHIAAGDLVEATADDYAAYVRSRETEVTL